MEKKERLGIDPFNWIQNTSNIEKEKTNLPNKQTKTQNSSISKLEKIIEEEKITKTSQTGLPQGWTRATFIVQESTLTKIKDLAYTERKQLKKIIDEALQSFTEGKEIIQRQK